jgi:hypothetical protein
MIKPSIIPNFLLSLFLGTAIANPAQSSPTFQLLSLTCQIDNFHELSAENSGIKENSQDQEAIRAVDIQCVKVKEGQAKKPFLSEEETKMLLDKLLKIFNLF